MKFFLADIQDAEGTLESIAQRTGYTIPSPRIYSMKYVHNGIEMVATVGQNPHPHYLEDGPIFCILQKGQALGICTPHRGLRTGSPILSGLDEAIEIEYFDDNDISQENSDSSH